MAQHNRRTAFAAGAVSFVVQHELWEGNIDDHADQGVAILVSRQAGGKETTLLRFNCFDLERSFGLEMRKQAGGDGGLAIHVLADLAGTPERPYMEETELLAFECFRDAPYYHYGPRNKNRRMFWDKTLVPDPLGWTLEQCKTGSCGT